jgi:hypothetical protein
VAVGVAVAAAVTIAVKAALESAVQFGQGDEVNRQAEMPSLRKCRDSLRFSTPSMAPTFAFPTTVQGVVVRVRTPRRGKDTSTGSPGSTASTRRRCARIPITTIKEYMTSTKG